MAQPIERNRVAGPWVLGLYGLAGATFIVTIQMAGWLRPTGPASLLFPFVAVFGGLAQFLAGMWAYEAGDALGTAMLGMWGSFWLGYGLLQALIVTGSMQAPAGRDPELALGFVVLAAVTWMCAVAATARNAALVTALACFAAASTVAVLGEGFDLPGAQLLSALLFIVAALVAWYTATAMMLDETFGRWVLPVGVPRSASPPTAETTEARRLREAPPVSRAG